MDTGKLVLTSSPLTARERIPNTEEDKFIDYANAAKDNCPVCKARSIKIMDADLKKSN